VNDERIPPRLQAVIDHVALQTAHFDAAVDFYTRILGAELLERRQFKRRQMAWLRLGEVRLELFSARDGETLAPWSDFTSGPVHLALRVPNLDEFLQHALLRAKYHPSHPARSRRRSPASTDRILARPRRRRSRSPRRIAVNDIRQPRK
jgi:hypothetical protein